MLIPLSTKQIFVHNLNKRVKRQKGYQWFSLTYDSEIFGFKIKRFKLKLNIGLKAFSLVGGSET